MEPDGISDNAAVTFARAVLLAASVAAATPAAAAVVRAPLAVLPAVPAAFLPPLAMSPVAPALFSPAAASAPELAAPPVPAALAAAAPSAAPAPVAAAPALAAPAARAAASEEPAAPAPAGKFPSLEAASVGAARLFDAMAAERAAGTVVPGLHATSPEDTAWLSAAAGALARTRTGRRVLKDIADLAARRGHPTILVVKAISNNGEFRYDSDLLVMDKNHLRLPPEQSAPILAHELQHVLQRAQGIPVDALEMEIESYTVENRVWSELGVSAKRDSFALAVRRRLLNRPDKFFKWINEQYEHNRLLHGTTMDSYVEWLKEQREKILRRREKAVKDVEKARAVARAMRAEKKPAKAIRAYEREEIEPIVSRLRDISDELRWADRDLAYLAQPENRAAFRKYSRGVIRRARALSRR
jgi:hypothetical protein